MPEGEPDAAIDARAPAPMCPYQPTAFDPRCEPSRAPPPACVVEVEGPATFRHARLTGRLDAAGRTVLREEGSDGAWPLREQIVYDAAGGHRITRMEDGRVVEIETRVIEGGRTTTTLQTDGAPFVVEAKLVDENGWLVERYVTLAHDPDSSRHSIFACDDRGRVIGVRQRQTEAGEVRTCTDRYVWRGECPVAPVDFHRSCL